MAEPTSSFCEFMAQMTRGNTDFLKSVLVAEDEFNAFIKDYEKLGKSLIRAKKTGNFSTFYNIKKDLCRRESSKENSCPNVETTGPSINKMANVRVKVEKLSISAETTDMPAPTIIPPKKKAIKTEKQSMSKRGKNNKNTAPSETRSNRSTRSTASSASRNSDVLITDPQAPMIELADSDEDNVEKKPSLRPTRSRAKKTVHDTSTTSVKSTRAKTKQLVELEKEDDQLSAPIRSTRTRTKQKRERSQNGAATPRNSKRSRSATNKSTTPNLSARTEYEDAVSELEEKLVNSTFILPKSQPVVKQSKTESTAADKNLNETVVVDKPKVQQLPIDKADDLLTDDESYEETVAVSPQKAQKEVFSPYHKSPVKKKVEAFENLQHQVAGSSKANTSRILQQMGENKGNVREKAKGFTPVNSRIMPNKAATTSASKISKYIGYKPPTLNDSLAKYCTPSSFKEKDLKRKEKEKELKRKELAKRAMSEDRKQRYMEKLLKVQQQKEAQEKEKLKAQEAQKLKDEKLKILMQQKEEKHRQLKEENERKRLMAKMRAEDRRKEEEALRKAAEEKMRIEQMKKKAELEILKKKDRKEPTDNLPIYMKRHAPLLPCDDCYDSDEEQGKYERRIPVWASSANIKKMSSDLTILGHRIKNTLFCSQDHFVDLKEVFEVIDPKKLKRTSSANWGRPPRFTMLPPFGEE